MRFTSRSFDEKGCSATRRNRRESTTFDTRPSPMAASAAPMASSQASRESGSRENGMTARWRGGAAATMRVKRATRPGYTGPSEFTWRNRPRSFSMSTISGSMNRKRGKEAINSSAGAGLVASNRLNEKNTGGWSAPAPPATSLAASPVATSCSELPSPYSYSTSRKLGSAMQRPRPI